MWAIEHLGAGIACEWSGGSLPANSNPTITDSAIANNTATSGGGGVYSDDSNPTISDSTVCGNDPDQIDGPWTDSGGNTDDAVCPADCLTDVNNDVFVGRNDVLAVVVAWDSDDPDADVDNDGLVGIHDLLTVLATWGPCQ